MAPIMGQCQVCDQTAAKYRCPNCTIPYCSVCCYRRHKETPCLKLEPLSAGGTSPLDDGSAAVHEQPVRSFEHDELDDSSWRLRRHQLQALAACDEVQLNLRDHNLQATIRRIDSAADAEEELAKALESPMFHAFAEKVLAVVGVERHEDALEGL